jgi:hypothetical protein
VEQHTKTPKATPYTQQRRHLAFNLFFVLIGVVGLLLVFGYVGPFYILVHSYGGNITASFAFYFVIKLAVTRQGWKQATSVLITILVTELFEVTNGFFGIMTNVYDPLDYLANALGVALAVAVDAFASYVLRVRKHRIRRKSDNDSHGLNNSNAA